MAKAGHSGGSGGAKSSAGRSKTATRPAPKPDTRPVQERYADRAEALDAADKRRAAVVKR